MTNDDGGRRHQRPTASDTLYDPAHNAAKSKDLICRTMTEPVQNALSRATAFTWCMVHAANARRITSSSVLARNILASASNYQTSIKLVLFPNPNRRGRERRFIRGARAGGRRQQQHSSSTTHSFTTSDECLKLPTSARRPKHWRAVYGRP